MYKKVFAFILALSVGMTSMPMDYSVFAAQMDSSDEFMSAEFGSSEEDVDIVRSDEDVSYESFDTVVEEETESYDDGSVFEDMSETMDMTDSMVGSDEGNSVSSISDESDDNGSVKTDVNISYVTVSLNALALTVGKKRSVKIDGLLKSERKQIVWESSDKDVAIVSRKGKVAGVGRGVAYITGTYKDKNTVYVAKVSVDAPKIDKKRVVLKVGQEYWLSMSGIVSTVPVWESKGKSVDLISRNRNACIKGVTKGKSKVFVKVNNKKYSINVKVLPETYKNTESSYKESVLYEPSESCYGEKKYSSNDAGNFSVFYYGDVVTGKDVIVNDGTEVPTDFVSSVSENSVDGSSSGTDGDTEDGARDEGKDDSDSSSVKQSETSSSTVADTNVDADDDVVSSSSSSVKVLQSDTGSSVKSDDKSDGGSFNVSSPSSNNAGSVVTNPDTIVKSGSSDDKGDSSSSTAGVTLRSPAATPIQSTTKSTVSVNARGYEGVYDGKSHSIVVSTTESGASIRYSSDGGNTYRTSNPRYTDAGTYTVNYSVKKTGFEPFYGSAQVVIAKADLNLSLSATEFRLPYKNSATCIITGNKGGGKLSVAGYDASVISCNTKNTTNKVYITSDVKSGNTVVRGVVDATKNYNAGNFEFVVNVYDNNLNVSSNGYSGTYDEQMHAIHVSCTDEDALIEYSSDGINYRKENFYYTDAGAYDVFYRVSKDGYRSVTGSETVDIRKADIAISDLSPLEDRAYDGNEHPIFDDKDVSSAAILYKYTNNTTKESVDWTKDLPSISKVGSYDIWYKVTGDDNHNDVSPVAKHVVISKADITDYSVEAISGLVYDGAEQELVSVEPTSCGTMYYGISSSATTHPVDWSKEIPVGVNARNYYLWYKIIADYGYNNVQPVRVDCNIAKDDINDLQVSVSNNFVYNGEFQSLVSANQINTGTVYYALGSIDSPETGWTLSIPKKMDAGVYYVWVKVEGDTNHNNVEPFVVVSDIAPIDGFLELSEDTGDVVYGQSIDFRIKTNLGKGDISFDYNKNQMDVEYEPDIYKVILTPKAVGDFYLTVRSEACGNYDAFETGYILRVSRAPINVQSEGYDGAYDNKYHSIKVKCDETDKIIYSVDGITYTSVNPEFKNVGEYDVYYKVDDSNYEPCIGSERVIIRKSTLDSGVDFITDSIIYDKKDHNLITPIDIPSSTVYYACMSSEGAVPSADDWSMDVPVASALGRYYIWYKAISNDSAAYEDIQPTYCALIDIAKQFSNIELSSEEGVLVYPENGSFTILENSGGGELSVRSSTPKIADVTLSGNKVLITNGTSRGVCTITVTSAETEFYAETNKVYTLTCENGTIGITYEAEDKSFVFDGYLHSLSPVKCFVDGQASDDCVVRYGLRNSNYVYNDVLETGLVYPGTREVFFVIRKPGYDSVYGSYNLQVTYDSSSYPLSKVTWDDFINICKTDLSMAQSMYSSGLMNYLSYDDLTWDYAYTNIFSNFNNNNFKNFFVNTVGIFNRMDYTSLNWKMVLKCAKKDSSILNEFRNHGVFAKGSPYYVDFGDITLSQFAELLDMISLSSENYADVDYSNITWDDYRKLHNTKYFGYSNYAYALNSDIYSALYDKCSSTNDFYDHLWDMEMHYEDGKAVVSGRIEQALMAGLASKYLGDADMYMFVNYFAGNTSTYSYSTGTVYYYSLLSKFVMTKDEYDDVDSKFDTVFDKMFYMYKNFKTFGDCCHAVRYYAGNNLFKLSYYKANDKLDLLLDTADLSNVLYLVRDVNSNVNLVDMGIFDLVASRMDKVRVINTPVSSLNTQMSLNNYNSVSTSSGSTSYRTYATLTNYLDIYMSFDVYDKLNLSYFGDFKSFCVYCANNKDLVFGEYLNDSDFVNYVDNLTLTGEDLYWCVNNYYSNDPELLYKLFTEFDIVGKTDFTNYSISSFKNICRYSNFMSHNLYTSDDPNYNLNHFDELIMNHPQLDMLRNNINKSYTGDSSFSINSYDDFNGYNMVKLAMYLLGRNKEEQLKNLATISKSGASYQISSVLKLLYDKFDEEDIDLFIDFGGFSFSSLSDIYQVYSALQRLDQDSYKTRFNYIIDELVAKDLCDVDIYDKTSSYWMSNLISYMQYDGFYDVLVKLGLYDDQESLNLILSNGSYCPSFIQAVINVRHTEDFDKIDILSHIETLAYDHVMYFCANGYWDDILNTGYFDNLNVFTWAQICGLIKIGKFDYIISKGYFNNIRSFSFDNICDLVRLGKADFVIDSGYFNYYDVSLSNLITLYENGFTTANIDAIDWFNGRVLSIDDINSLIRAGFTVEYLKSKNAYGDITYAELLSMISGGHSAADLMEAGYISTGVVLGEPVTLDNVCDFVENGFDTSDLVAMGCFGDNKFLGDNVTSELVQSLIAAGYTYETIPEFVIALCDDVDNENDAYVYLVKNGIDADSVRTYLMANRFSSYSTVASVDNQDLFRKFVQSRLLTVSDLIASGWSYRNICSNLRTDLSFELFVNGGKDDMITNYLANNEGRMPVWLQDEGYLTRLIESGVTVSDFRKCYVVRNAGALMDAYSLMCGYQYASTYYNYVIVGVPEAVMADDTYRAYVKSEFDESLVFRYRLINYGYTVDDFIRWGLIDDISELNALDVMHDIVMNGSDVSNLDGFDITDDIIDTYVKDYSFYFDDMVKLGFVDSYETADFSYIYRYIKYNKLMCLFTSGCFEDIDDFADNFVIPDEYIVKMFEDGLDSAYINLLLSHNMTGYIKSFNSRFKSKNDKSAVNVCDYMCHNGYDNMIKDFMSSPYCDYSFLQYVNERLCYGNNYYPWSSSRRGDFDIMYDCDDRYNSINLITRDSALSHSVWDANVYCLNNLHLADRMAAYPANHFIFYRNGQDDYGYDKDNARFIYYIQNGVDVESINKLYDLTDLVNNAVLFKCLCDYHYIDDVKPYFNDIAFSNADINSYVSRGISLNDLLKLWYFKDSLGYDDEFELFKYISEHDIVATEYLMPYLNEFNLSWDDIKYFIDNGYDMNLILNSGYWSDRGLTDDEVVYIHNANRDGDLVASGYYNTKTFTESDVIYYMSLYNLDNFRGLGSALGVTFNSKVDAVIYLIKNGYSYYVKKYGYDKMLDYKTSDIMTLIKNLTLDEYFDLSSFETKDDLLKDLIVKGYFDELKDAKYFRNHVMSVYLVYYLKSNGYLSTSDFVDIKYIKNFSKINVFELPYSDVLKYIAAGYGNRVLQTGYFENISLTKAEIRQLVDIGYNLTNLVDIGLIESADEISESDMFDFIDMGLLPDLVSVGYFNNVTVDFDYICSLQCDMSKPDRFVAFMKTGLYHLTDDDINAYIDGGGDISDIIDSGYFDLFSFFTLNELMQIRNKSVIIYLFKHGLTNAFDFADISDDYLNYCLTNGVYNEILDVEDLNVYDWRFIKYLGRIGYGSGLVGLTKNVGFGAFDEVMPTKLVQVKDQFGNIKSEYYSNSPYSRFNAYGYCCIEAEDESKPVTTLTVPEQEVIVQCVGYDPNRGITTWQVKDYTVECVFYGRRMPKLDSYADKTDEVFGDAIYDANWDESYFRTEFLTEYLANLDIDESIIELTDHYTVNAKRSVCHTQDKLFVPSYYEMYGHTPTNVDYGYYEGASDGKDLIYWSGDYFGVENASNLKRYMNDSHSDRVAYYLRSYPVGYDSSSGIVMNAGRGYSIVNNGISNGGGNGYDGSCVRSRAYAVFPAFCI